MLLRRLVALVPALLAACGGEPAVDSRSVVLVTLDTTRCDALDGFGGEHGIALNLDRLASEGVRYVQARTVAPLTLPAHASMLTGLVPPRHTVRSNGPATLPPEAVTVAERALAAGFQTAGFVGGLSLDRGYGIAQGFEHWTQPEQSSTRLPGEISDRPADQVVRDARAWLAGRDRARPFFLWVHVFDPHAPYAPGAEFLQRAGGVPYYGEVAAMDSALGGLFDDLAREGILARAVVIVAADHGEALGEHGEDTHGLHVWDSTLRVPFFVRYPDRFRAGEASAETVSVVDIAPTALEAMALVPPEDLDGLSLYRRRVPQERGAYFESFFGWARFGWSPLAGWIDGAGKYVHSSKPQFFRPREDPLEERDALAEAGGAPSYLEALRELLARPPIRARAAAAGSGALSAVVELGYGGAGEIEPEYPDPLAVRDLPPPHERIDEYREFCEAEALNHAGRFAEAVPKLERILRDNPRSLQALDELSLALAESKDWERAIEVLGERAKLPPDRLSTHQRLVQCYTALGNAEASRVHALRALELLIQVHEQRGEQREAERYRAIYEAETAKSGQ